MYAQKNDIFFICNSMPVVAGVCPPDMPFIFRIMYFKMNIRNGTYLERKKEEKHFLVSEFEKSNPNAVSHGDLIFPATIVAPHTIPNGSTCAKNHRVTEPKCTRK